MCLVWEMGLTFLLAAVGFLGRTVLCANVSQPIVPALIIFGDSTLDVGNNNYLVTVVKSDFAPYGRLFEGGKPTGRFSDGQLVVDYAATKLGLPLIPAYLDPNAHGEAILTGVNFASAASGLNDDTALHFNVKGMTAQLAWYKLYRREVLTVAGQERGNYILSNALYAIGSGSNDYVNNYFMNPVLSQQYNTDGYQALLLGNLRQYVQELYGLGARKIVILGLPPIGCLPAQISLHNGQGKCIEEYNQVALRFNAGLQQLVEEEMKPQMSGARLFILDIYTYLYEVFQNPTQYGFTQARTACCGTGDLETAILCNAAVGSCADGYGYLFWDSFHPTTHFYQQLTDKILPTVISDLSTPPQG